MGKIILFQGDSITDSGRNRENDRFKGYGYATMVSGVLGAQEPCKYEFYNRGISANRIVDLYARMKVDIINLKPDYLSILMGINGVWHEASSKNGVDVKKFEMIYNMLISEIKEALPDVKIMLLEPFVLHGSATQDIPENPNRWEYFRTETVLRREAVKRVAEKQNVLFVPLQEMFDKADAAATEECYWLYDGVHPTAAGHELIKQAWLEAFEKIR